MSSTNPHAQPPSSYRRKSTSKRPLVHSDDDGDDDGDDTPVPQRTKRARTVDTDAPLSVATTPDDQVDRDIDVDVDVETLRDQSLSAADDSRFLPEDHGSPLHPKAPKKRRRSTVVSTSTRKKQQVVYSDDQEHIERDSVESDLSDALSDVSDDDDFGLDTSPRRGASKVKAGAAKVKAGKAKQVGHIRAAKARGPREKDKDREVFIKDERKPVQPNTAFRASSTAAQTQPLELFNEDPAPSSAADPLPDASQATKDPLGLTIPKKRKLPPIKKTKAATDAVTPTTAAQKPVPPPVQELAKPSLPTSEQRKQALTGVRDIDLGDSKIYAELFKGAGGITPRSGLKNAEERRKELDKMRDEARARRAEEAKFTFDLQYQADKIARFEQRLRGENSTVLHPNFLAAKFRDEWEVDKRNKRATPKEEGEA